MNDIPREDLTFEKVLKLLKQEDGMALIFYYILEDNKKMKNEIEDLKNCQKNINDVIDPIKAYKRVFVSINTFLVFILTVLNIVAFFFLKGFFRK